MLAAAAVGCTDRAAGDSTTEAATLAPSTASTTLDGTTTSGTADTTAAPTTTTAPTTGTATSGPPACEPYTIKVLLPLITAHIVLVVDQSPAMMDPWDHDADPQTPERPRWASVRAALETVLPLAVADGAALGLVRYPGLMASDEYGAQACAVEPGEFIAPVEDAADTILAALPPADATLVGAAPLRAALVGALDLLAAVPDGDPRALVIITHSAPNCAEAAPDLPGLLEGLDAAVQQQLSDAARAGLWLGVVAVGAAADASPVLEDMRPDGVDLAAYWQEASLGLLDNASDEADLAHDLEWLLTDQTDHSCAVALDPAPGPDQHVAAVRVGAEPVAGPVTDCQSEAGWHLPDPGLLELCGAACQLFIETGDLEIDVACSG